MVVITLNFTVIMISIYRSLLGQLDYIIDTTLHLRTSFVMWYVLSPLSFASSSSLSFFFCFFPCGCIRVYQWSVQEPLSPRLATGYSPVDHWCSLSVLSHFPLAPNFGVFNNNNNEQH